jgi:hypothetical protein
VQGLERDSSTKTRQQYSNMLSIPARSRPAGAVWPSTTRLYIIENVEGAPLRDPVALCGALFPGLRTLRHRLFEASFPARPLSTFVPSAAGPVPGDGSRLRPARRARQLSALAQLGDRRMER